MHIDLDAAWVDCRCHSFSPPKRRPSSSIFSVRDGLAENDECVVIFLLKGYEHHRDIGCGAIPVSLARRPPDDIVEPMHALFHAYEGFAPVMEARRACAKPWQELIDAHPALQERELAKVAALADAFARGLEARGAATLSAALAARIGMAAIVQATSGWLVDEEPHPRKD